MLCVSAGPKRLVLNTALIFTGPSSNGPNSLSPSSNTITIITRMRQNQHRSTVHALARAFLRQRAESQDSLKVRYMRGERHALAGAGLLHHPACRAHG